MNKTVETIGDATGETGWRKTYARKWTPPAQVCGAWRCKVEQTPEQVMRSALARIAELIRDEWPTPEHKQGCNAAFGDQYRCRCGLAEEQADRDEALRLCQLDRAKDTL